MGNQPKVQLVQTKDGITIVGTGTATVAVHLDTAGRMGILTVVNDANLKPTIMMVEEKQSGGLRALASVDGFLARHAPLVELMAAWKKDAEDAGLNPPGFTRRGMS